MGGFFIVRKVDLRKSRSEAPTARHIPRRWRSVSTLVQRHAPDIFRKIEQVKKLASVLKSSTSKYTRSREEEKIDERDHTEALHKAGHARHGVACGNGTRGCLVNN